MPLVVLARMISLTLLTLAIEKLFFDIGKHVICRFPS